MKKSARQNKSSTGTGGSFADKPAFLEGEKIYLRPLEMEDLESFYRWFNKSELRKYTQIPYPLSREMEKEFIENAMRPGDTIVLAIVLKNNDRMIGDISINTIDNIHRKAFIGIAIGDPGYISRGYGTEALKLLLDYAFGTLNLHRIELHAYAFNKRAIDCYKKMGFKEEGRSREAHFADGRYQDIVNMAILDSEWHKKYS